MRSPRGSNTGRITASIARWSSCPVTLVEGVVLPVQSVERALDVDLVRERLSQVDWSQIRL
ncbi:hypothetical protein BJF90_35365 [Pseudonocardia sp. CNS-004]|nr:hypothetical protein BJF90_35365 [Pseudonocardia sp. CNS-004]